MPPIPSDSVPYDSRAAPAQRWRFAGLAFCVVMLGVHVMAGMNTNGVSDYWRDMYWAAAIAHGERFPLAGPQIYQLFELGPWWFYLLALPMWATSSVALTMAFVQSLAATKYFLALHLGTRIADARLGFAFAVSLAIAGWSMLPLMFPSHTALVETTLLLLALVTWRSWSRFSLRNAILLGLASAACVHAHPTTLSYVALAGTALLCRHRSRAAFGWMGVAAAITLLSLLPPWLDRSALVESTLKTVPSYLGGDIAVHPLQRIPEVLRSLVVGGAWWALLLMTPWKASVARFAWWVFCAFLLFAAFGVWRVRRSQACLFRLAIGAAALLVVQVCFVVMLRPVTPMWMVGACLPPLALSIAIGWYGWLCDVRRVVRIGAITAMAAYVALCVAPFSFFLRDVHAVRVMPGVNPFFNVSERSDRYVNVAVPFYPVRRIDRLAKTLCGPAVLHGRLAAVIEASFATPVRNACGSWPDLHYGGIDGQGLHIAGLLLRSATASGIAPARVVAHMALYDRVRAIAPAVGGRSAPVRRLQIYPDSGIGPAKKSVSDFDADGGDVVVLTNRQPNAAPLEVMRSDADGRPATLLSDDGSSRVYGCTACAPAAVVHWHVELNAIEANLDLVVLLR